MSALKMTEEGFPKGRVAETLRRILNRDLREHDVEAITVVLFCHLLVEDRLNRILYALLVYDLPRKGSGDTEVERQAAEIANLEMEEKVWASVRQTFFVRKLEYIEPCLVLWYPKLPRCIREINSVRNSVMHGRRSEDLKFEGDSIWTELGIEKYFLRSQYDSMDLDKLHEMIDARRARAERLAKRLQELGEF